MPCDLVPSQPGDSVYLVLWYKKDGKTPIYSYDSRAGAPDLWSEPSVFGGRARFIDYSSGQPSGVFTERERSQHSAVLKIVDVSKLHDEGKLVLSISS